MKDRCPNSVGDAKQTLEIRVEPRRDMTLVVFTTVHIWTTRPCTRMVVCRFGWAKRVLTALSKVGHTKNEICRGQARLTWAKWDWPGKARLAGRGEISQAKRYWPSAASFCRAKKESTLTITNLGTVLFFALRTDFWSRNLIRSLSISPTCTRFW